MNGETETHFHVRDNYKIFQEYINDVLPLLQINMNLFGTCFLFLF